jgi:hypothetical protein
MKLIKTKKKSKGIGEGEVARCVRYMRGTEVYEVYERD